jgi:SAM-dependent methyltransferase
VVAGSLPFAGRNAMSRGSTWSRLRGSTVLEHPEELTPRAGYAAWASCYDDDGNPLMALEGPAVAEWLGPLQGRRALDLGCGTGRHTLKLASLGARAVALDQSPEMMARAREKLGDLPVDWVLHRLPDPLPFRDSVFEIVVLGLVAEHVADLAAMMSEVARVLVPGGRCILSALHSDQTAQGMRARFIDPATGLRRPIVTYHRTAADYHAAAELSGLRDPEERTLIVPPELPERLPRAERYVGQKLGWVARWTRPIE